MGVLLSIVSSSLFKKILPFIIGGVICASLYMAGYMIGQQNAVSKCKASELTAQLNAEKIKEKNLQDQLNADQVEISNLNTQKQKIKTITNTVIKTVIQKIPVDKACDIPPDIVKEINKARSGS